MRRHEHLVSFTKSALLDAIQKASHGTDREPETQARFLATYLQQRRPPPQTMLVESPYVDRHYLQEFVGYYATKLTPPPHHTTRIHFFSAAYTQAAWKELLVRALDAPQAVEAELEGVYLGYVVVRPIATCPIGRTLLRPYEDHPSRFYEPARTRHGVHLAGLTLLVSALPFQQQDEGLGACATTALWTLLARVLRADGGRAVTPLEVTAAAHGAQQHGGVLAASEGLDLDAMLRAIRGFGYVPHYFRMGDHAALFVLLIKSYLRSGVPVMLRYHVGGVLHAAAAVGYRESDDEEGAADLPIALGDESIGVRGLTRLYVHDDRLGPYARVILRWRQDEERGLVLRVCFEPRERGYEGFEEELLLFDAVVGLYPKLRLTAQHLVGYVADFFPNVRTITAIERRAELRVEPYFEQGGDYLARLPRVLKDPDRNFEVRSAAFLSRYVGVIRFYVGEDWVCDFVLDTTDVRRDRQRSPGLLLIIPADLAAWHLVADQLRTYYGTELI